MTPEQEALMTTLGKMLRSGIETFTERDLATQLGWTLDHVSKVLVELEQLGMVTPAPN